MLMMTTTTIKMIIILTRMMLSVNYDTGDIHNNDQDHDDYNDDDDVVYYRYLHFSLGEGSLVFADLLVLFLTAQPVGNISSPQSCKRYHCLEPIGNICFDQSCKNQYCPTCWQYLLPIGLQKTLLPNPLRVVKIIITQPTSGKHMRTSGNI